MKKIIIIASREGNCQARDKAFSPSSPSSHILSGRSLIHCISCLDKKKYRYIKKELTTELKYYEKAIIWTKY